MADFSQIFPRLSVLVFCPVAFFALEVVAVDVHYSVYLSTLCLNLSQQIFSNFLGEKWWHGVPNLVVLTKKLLLQAMFAL